MATEDGTNAELLVLRAQLGERDALTDLVRNWHAPVWVYVRRMLDASTADDVSQEVWVAALRGLPRLKEPARFAPWLFTIARRAVANQLREEYARAEAPADPTEGGEEPLNELLDRDELLAGLAEVPVREREVLVLFYLQDLSLEDCAAICAIPVGTVKSRLSRGRRLLRDNLTEKELKS
jgi:RNA polymerase sigma-70 factor (ECF subfamily)